MTDRDHELSRLLAGIDPPQHRPGFWADLHADLQDARPSGAVTARPEPDDGPSLSDHHAPVSLDERRAERSTTARRPLLVAAALVVVGLLGLGFLASRDEADDSVGITADQTDGERGSGVSGDDPSQGPDTSVDVVRTGTGSPIAIDPTGAFLYVADVPHEIDAPQDAGTGCEGAERKMLFVEPIDGERRLVAVPDFDVEATGGLEVAFGPDGAVAIVEGCEGFTNRVLTGRIQPDGTIGDVAELTGLSSDGSRNIVDITWRTAGSLVATTVGFTATGEERALIEFPSTMDEVTDLGRDDLVWVDAAADGTLATVSTDGTVRLGDRELGVVDESFGVVVSADGQRVVSFGGDGMAVFGDATVGVVTDTTTLEAAILDDGRLVYRTLGPDDTAEIRTVETGRIEPEQVLLRRARVTDLQRLVASPDGSFVVTESSNDPDPARRSPTTYTVFATDD